MATRSVSVRASRTTEILTAVNPQITRITQTTGRQRVTEPRALATDCHHSTYYRTASGSDRMPALNSLPLALATAATTQLVTASRNAQLQPLNSLPLALATATQLNRPPL